MNQTPEPANRLWDIDGSRGRITVREWPHAQARYLALVAHGAGEHIGRYAHVAAALSRDGAAVLGPDHQGHGRSAGERMSILDFEEVVADLHVVAARAALDYPGLPTVLIGHSMGGMIAARYAQHFGAELAALVLSGPVIGPWPVARMLLAMDPMPEVPIDPAVLSRDPEVGRAYAADPLVWHGAIPRASLEAVVRCLAAIDAGAALGALPTLWIHGEQDALVPVDAARQGVEHLGATALHRHVYPGARHEVFNETNQVEVLADVMAFIRAALARCRARSSQ